MLTLLNISNITLIDELRVELERGLNLLTGETGSGKSIIVDALGVLIGGRFTSEMVKNNARSAFIEGLFSIGSNSELDRILQNAGIETNDGATGELLIRREVSSSRNRIFINNQLATLTLLREIRPLLVDIHGQGDQQTLFNPQTLLEDLAFKLRDFSEKLEFSPTRLAEVENRLAEVSRLTRKYGGSIESALEHLARSEDRLRRIERADEREEELRAQLNEARKM